MNRRGFIEKTLQMNRDHEGEELLILFADLDHLKEINDFFGHIEGDFSIRHCAEVLKKVVGADGIVGRIGGDEFCVVTLGNLKDGQQIIERIREESDAFNCTSDKEYYVELSAGCTSVICRNGLVIADALRKADRALYEVKKLRRNSVKKSGYENIPCSGSLFKLLMSYQTVCSTISRCTVWISVSHCYQCRLVF